MLLVGVGMGLGVQVHRDAPRSWNTALEPQCHPGAGRETFSLCYRELHDEKKTKPCRLSVLRFSVLRGCFDQTAKSSVLLADQGFDAKWMFSSRR